MNQKLNTPWTPGEVIQLNKMQDNPMFHGYTCGAGHSQLPEGLLIATTDGWVCGIPECDYKQDWAVLFVLPHSFKELLS